MEMPCLYFIARNVLEPVFLRVSISRESFLAVFDGVQRRISPTNSNTQCCKKARILVPRACPHYTDNFNIGTEV